MKEIITTTKISAPVERLWELLTDLSLLCHWNPLFVHASGDLAMGNRLRIRVKLPPIDEFTIEPVVGKVVPLQELSWKHRYLWLVTWQHAFDLKTLPDGQILFSQRVRFSGLLAPLWHFGLGNQMRLGCEEMNRALKRWGEKSVRCLKC